MEFPRHSIERRSKTNLREFKSPRQTGMTSRHGGSLPPQFSYKPGAKLLFCTGNCAAELFSLWLCRAAKSGMNFALRLWNRRLQKLLLR